MSRSFRHSPVGGNSMAASEKRDKVRAHKAERAAVRSAVDVEDVVGRADVWTWAKDGKSSWGSVEGKGLRK